MPTKFAIIDAFESVNSGDFGEYRVVYDKAKDCLYYRSDLAGINEIPEDLDWDQCVEIPHRNDLDLGQALVFRFVETQLPNEYDRIREFFSRRGAYARFKDFLADRGLLDDWHQFENDATEEAVVRWCAEQGIVLAPS